MNPADEAADARLDRQLAALQREIPPPQDLWLRIAPALEAPRRSAAARPGRWSVLPRHLWLLPSAALAAAAIVATIILLPPFFERASLPSADLPQARVVPVDPEAFAKARTTLEPQFAAVLAQLAPATRVRIERDLAIVRTAQADVAAALGGDPANPLLIEFWQRTKEHEIDLMTDVLSRSRSAATRRQT